MESQDVGIGSWDATVRKLATPMGLVVDEVRLRASAETAITTKPFAVTLEKPATLEARISEQGLAAFLNAQSPGGLKDFQVQLSDGKVTASASARMLIEIRATAVCTLKIVDGRQIWVELQQVEVFGGINAKGLVEGQLEKVNPVLDVSDLPLRVILTGVAIDSGYVIVYGEALPPAPDAGP
ncbi:MAG TPA: LmeA family phospholipid-binding protein [Fimbriimonadaceae bacterium]|nr:LmeA family phospholipid-binding protein [Fimbriimonadaceae bacterium]